MEEVNTRDMPPADLEPLLSRISASYVALERVVRETIDRVVGPICATCERVCCKASYCRRTMRNPWYRFLFETYGGADIPWQRREPPPGLGPDGCDIRAGRYAYCSAYNCLAVLSSLDSDEDREIFQGISDILKDVGLNFLGKRHLTDLMDWEEITLPRLRRFEKKIEEGTKRFNELRSLLFMDKPGK